jgi:hypothetical protein
LKSQSPLKPPLPVKVAQSQKTLKKKIGLLVENEKFMKYKTNKNKRKKLK